MRNVSEELSSIRTLVCDRFLLAAAVASFPVTAVSCYRATTVGWVPALSLFVLLALGIIAITIVRHRLTLRTKGLIIIGFLFAVGLGGMVQFGLLAASVVFLVMPPIVSAVLFDRRTTALTLAGVAVVMAGLAAHALLSPPSPGLELTAFVVAPINWLNEACSMLFIAGAMGFAFQGFSDALVSALLKARHGQNELRAALAEQLSAEAKAKHAQKVALVSLADLAEYRDSDTGEHVQRVASMTHEIARTLMHQGVEPETCTAEFLEHIGIASILHDVGKVSIPDSVLLKPGKLSPEEREVMKTHAEVGGAILGKAARMLPDSLHFQLATEIALGHHECWDGTGYPAGLAGGDIPLAARIVAVADVFDALTAKRPYKQPWSKDSAVDFVRERSGLQFDPQVVAAFFAVLASREQASAVEWSSAIAIGHPIIDQDHRILLQLINQIANSENADDPAAVGFVLDELINYTHFHFTREEEMLARAGYPGLDEHRAHHAEMIAEVEDLQRRFVAQNAGIGGELSQFLAMWLVNHIMSDDRQYQPFIVAEPITAVLAG